MVVFLIGNLVIYYKENIMKNKDNKEGNYTIYIKKLYNLNKINLLTIKKLKKTNLFFNKKLYNLNKINLYFIKKL